MSDHPSWASAKWPPVDYHGRRLYAASRSDNGWAASFGAVGPDHYLRALPSGKYVVTNNDILYAIPAVRVCSPEFDTPEEALLWHELTTS